MIVEFSTEVSTYRVRDPEPDYFNNVPYSDRGETATILESVTAAVSTQEPTEDHWGESLVKDMPGVERGDTVHVVVVVYQSGDTFGLDGGHTKVLDAFTDVDEAGELAKATREHGKSDFNFNHNGRSYYAPWAGYFEHIESVEVWGVEIKGHHAYRRRY